MNEYCDNERCEKPGFKEVPVSVRRAGDETRTFCATCEEAWSIGVQHGTFAAREETAEDRARLENLLRAGCFVVLGLNRDDPSPGAAFEAWAYQGPLDFRTATPLAFGLGSGIVEAISALNERLAREQISAAMPASAAHRRNALYLDDRELATVLAALRYYQAENLQRQDEIPDQAVLEVASDNGRLKPLSYEEVDALCERLNLSKDAPSGPLHVVVTVSGGVAEVIRKPCGVTLTVYDYDVEGADEGLSEDPEGKACRLLEWKAEEGVATSED